MNITGIDLETTGLDHKKGERIIEISLVKANSDNWSEPWVAYEQRINPRRAIQPGATKVHHITSDMVGESPYFEDVVDDILGHLKGTDVLVAHNMDFDGPFFASELMRIGKDMDDAPVLFCTMQNGRWATGSGKYPNLGELCFACGVPYDADAAHAALYDTDRMMHCFMRGITEGWYTL